MNAIGKLIGCVVVGALVMCMTACSDDGISKKEIDSIKNSPKMTEKDWEKVGAGMKEGAEARQSSQAEWAKAHPEEAARVNAERARAGKPPLGG